MSCYAGAIHTGHSLQIDHRPIVKQAVPMAQLHQTAKPPCCVPAVLFFSASGKPVLSLSFSLRMVRDRAHDGGARSARHPQARHASDRKKSWSWFASRASFPSLAGFGAFAARKGSLDLPVCLSGRPRLSPPRGWMRLGRSMGMMSSYGSNGASAFFGNRQFLVLLVGRVGLLMRASATTLNFR